MNKEWEYGDLPAVSDMTYAEGDAERYGASVAKAEILKYLNLHYLKVSR